MCSDRGLVTIEVVGLYTVWVAIGIGDDRGSQAVHSVCSDRNW